MSAGSVFLLVVGIIIIVVGGIFTVSNYFLKIGRGKMSRSAWWEDAIPFAIMAVGGLVVWWGVA